MVGSSMADAAEFFAGLGVELKPGEIVDHMNATVMASILKELDWRPGALELLEALHAAGVPNALVTNSTRILADARISIDAVLQKEPAEGATRLDIIMLTHQTRERNIDAAIEKMEQMETVVGTVTRIRLESLS